MPLDRGTRGTDPVVPRPRRRSRAAQRRDELREARAHVAARQQPKPIMGEDPADKRPRPVAPADPTGLDRIVQPGTPEYTRATRHRRTVDLITKAAIALPLVGSTTLEGGVSDIVRTARAAKETLLDPAASRREKIEAAAGVTMIAGMPGGPGRPRKPRLPAARDTEALYNEWQILENMDTPLSPREIARRNELRAQLTEAGRIQPPQQFPQRMGKPVEQPPAPGPPDITFTARQILDAIERDPGSRAIPRVAKMEQEARAILAQAEQRAPVAVPGAEKVVASLGGEPPVPPRPTASGAEPPTPQPSAEERIGASLEEARQLREQQEAGYSTERAKRIQAADEAFAQAGGGLAGHVAAKAQLAGELPKLKFNAISKEGISQPELDRVLDYVKQHPDFQGYRGISAREAIQGVTEGRVPTRSELLMLEELFGIEKATEIAKDIELWMRARDLLGDAASLPRAFKSGADVSAGLRQGGLVLASHPGVWKGAWGPSMRSMKYATPAQRTRLVERAAEEIVRRPNYERARKGGVVFSGIRGGSREEAFMSSMADHIPVIGHSAQAYTVFLNRLRADFFDHLIKVARKDGMDVDNVEFLRHTGKIVNTMTGRGSLEEYEGAVKALAAIFFSPRLMASRFKMLGRAAHPYTWTGGRGPKANPAKRLARREARRAISSFIGAGTGILLLADQMPEVEVGMDPRSADFGKIKIGDTRVDLWGGFQQYVVTAARMATGEKVMSDTGEVRKLEGYGTGRVGGSLTNFFENKFSPWMAYWWGWDEAGAATGRDFDPVKEAGLLFAPIGVQGAVETGKEYGPGRAAAEFGASFVGLGAQTYGASPAAPKPPKNAAERLAQDLRAEQKVARKLGVNMPPQVKEALRLQSRLQQAVTNLERQEKKRGDVVTPAGRQFKLTARQKAAAELAVIGGLYPEHAPRLKEILGSLKTPRQIESFRNQLKAEAGLDVLEQWHEETNEALEERALAAAP